MQRDGAAKVGFVVLVLWAGISLSLAEGTTTGAVAKAVPLDLLSPFAALAAGIAIAYAALPSFRYRKRVRRHIRRRVTRASLIASLYMAGGEPNKLLCAQDAWSVLYRLGHLVNYKKAPAPTKQKDRYFSNTIPYMLYSGLFASNLDKYTTLVLGAFAASIIWFAGLDSIHFHEFAASDPDRISYLTALHTTYYTMSVIAMLAFILHVALWRWEMPKRGIRRRAIDIPLWVGGVLIAALIFLVSIGTSESWMFQLCAKIGPHYQENVFKIFELVLFIAGAVPVVLLLVGEYLTAKMIEEADRAYDDMLALITDQASQAKITPIAPPITAIAPEGPQ
jgi:hypothetical protein